MAIENPVCWRAKRGQHEATAQGVSPSASACCRACSLVIGGPASPRPALACACCCLVLAQAPDTRAALFCLLWRHHLCLDLFGRFASQN